MYTYMYVNVYMYIYVHTHAHKHILVKFAAQELHEMLRQESNLHDYPFLASTEVKRALICPEGRKCHFEGVAHVCTMDVTCRRVFV